jgi:hypothetical protein
MLQKEERVVALKVARAYRGQIERRQEHAVPSVHLTPSNAIFQQDILFDGTNGFPDSPDLMHAGYTPAAPVFVVDDAIVPHVDHGASLTEHHI